MAALCNATPDTLNVWPSVQDLLALHDKYSTMISIHFSGHGAFQKSLTDSFTNIVNRDLAVSVYVSMDPLLIWVRWTTDRIMLSCATGQQGNHGGRACGVL